MKFFEKVLPNFPREQFAEYLKADESGFLVTLMFEKVCFVIPMSEKIDQWVGEEYNRRLHSDTKEALEVAGLKMYFLNGVQFPHDLWSKVVSREMPFEEILGIRDIDQRTQAMKYADVEKFLSHSGAKLLDKSVRGNELYQIPHGEMFTEDAYYLKYSCPSTSKVYMSGVPKEIGEQKDADNAMAWKHFLSKEAYALLAMENEG